MKKLPKFSKFIKTELKKAIPELVDFFIIIVVATPIVLLISYWAAYKFNWLPLGY